MANPLEHELDYLLGEALPPTGAAMDVAPGVRWLRMPLPFALNHINVWLLRDEVAGQAGWTIVDCGLATPDTRAAWEQVFAGELQGLPVLRVVATHMHPDHIGLADWITRRWSTPAADCRLWMSAAEWFGARTLVSDSGGVHMAFQAEFMARHGWRAPARFANEAPAPEFRQLVPALPPAFARLGDGRAVDIGGRTWRCRVGHGHSPEHVSLYCADLNVLISGDMVLPRISTNMSVLPVEPEANPLADYLRSIDALADLPEDVLVLPSHGKPFRGLHARIRQLHAHHDERLGALREACRRAPCSAADVLPAMFGRDLTPHEVRFGMGEALAHLHALWYAGELRREVDAGGGVRFRCA